MHRRTCSARQGRISSPERPTSSLTKSGAGTLTLSSANTITGGVRLNAGTLNINNAGVKTPLPNADENLLDGFNRALQEVLPNGNRVLVRGAAEPQKTLEIVPLR